MVIISQIRSAIGYVAAQLFTVGLGVVVVVLAPILMFAPLVLLAFFPNADFRELAQFFVFAAPLSTMFYMGILCHFHSLRRWKLLGRDSRDWRGAQGGWIHTFSKSFGFMALGLFGGFACNVLFAAAFQFVDVSGTMRHALWFLLFPFAAYAPCIFVIIKRWNFDKEAALDEQYPQRNWSETRRLASSELFNSPELDAMDAEQSRIRDARILRGLGVSNA